jgi:hypothetical protein
MRKKYSLGFVPDKYLGLRTKFSSRGSGHDVVIVKRHFLSHKYDVVTITSLSQKCDVPKTSKEKEIVKQSNKFNGFRTGALKESSEGNIIPVPIKDLKSKHWSGLYVSKPFTVNEKEVDNSHNCHAVLLPKKYRKLMG